MVVFFLLLLSACFLIYGGLVITRKFTPPTSKLLIEEMRI